MKESVDIRKVYELMVQGPHTSSRMEKVAKYNDKILKALNKGLSKGDENLSI